MSDASILRCPSCGAAVDPEVGVCPYCKAKVDAIRCPWCFAWSCAEHDCPHCGATAPPDAGGQDLLCPSCRQELVSRTLGGAVLSGCGRCGGVWVDAVSFKKICQDRAAQTAYLGNGTVTAAPKPSDPSASPAAYRPCARCREFMNRVNFAGRSGVVLDVCKPHGVWFDPDELGRIIQFIRDGGLDLARQRERESLEEERRRLEQAKREPLSPLTPHPIVVASGIIDILSGGVD
jgi:Zn-finger nucleic acid-binding protein